MVKGHYFAVLIILTIISSATANGEGITPGISSVNRATLNSFPGDYNFGQATVAHVQKPSSEIRPGDMPALMTLTKTASKNTGLTYAQSQPTPNSTSKNKTVEILGIDPIAFPKIKVNIFIDKFCAMAGNLKKENFKVNENGTDMAIDNLYFTGNASGKKLDLAIVFDDTHSMVGEIDAMKAKVEDLTNTIKASGMDANYSLVSFKDSVSVKTKWTKDQAVIRKNVNSLQADGGGDEPEDSMDAIEAVLSMGFRPDAQKVILVITDAHAHYKNDSSAFSKYTQEEIEKDLKDSGAIFIPVSPTFAKPSAYVDLKMVANDIQSMWIDMGSANFSTILEQFKGILTGTYVIEYTSPDQTPSEYRTVSVSVNAPGCVAGSASGTYTTPGSTPADSQVALSAPNSVPTINNFYQTFYNSSYYFEADWPIPWYADASDPDGDQVLYRFFLNDNPMTNWTKEPSWIWTPVEPGIYQIKVQVRDGKHAGPNGMDDWRSYDVEITPPDMNSLKQAKYNLKRRLGVLNETAKPKVIHDSANNNQTAEPVSLEPVPVVEAHGDTWQKTFGGVNLDSAHSFQQTSDGGYIIAGDTESYERSVREAWLIKTDSSGNKLWEKTLSGPNSDANFDANSVQQTSDEGYIIAGNNWKGGGDAWLIKTDSSGNKQWEKTFGGPYLDMTSSVQQTSDGGYIIAGEKSVGSSEYSYDMTHYAWLIKTDSLGNNVWNRTFGGGDSYASSVQRTSDGGYIIAGECFLDVLFIKIDYSGVEQWNRTFDGSNWDSANSVQQTSDGGYIIAGMTNGSIGDGAMSRSAWLIETDSSGNLQWNKIFGSGSNYDVANSVQQTSDGGYIIAGTTNSKGSGKNDALLIKTDSLGNMQWERTFGGLNDDSAGKVLQTRDGGYIIAGNTKSYGAGGTDAWLIKTDANGNVYALAISD